MSETKRPDILDTLQYVPTETLIELLKKKNLTVQDVRALQSLCDVETTPRPQVTISNWKSKRSTILG